LLFLSEKVNIKIIFNVILKNIFQLTQSGSISALKLYIMIALKHGRGANPNLIFEDDKEFLLEQMQTLI